MELLKSSHVRALVCMLAGAALFGVFALEADKELPMHIITGMVVALTAYAGFVSWKMLTTFEHAVSVALAIEIANVLSVLLAMLAVGAMGAQSFAAIFFAGGVVMACLFMAAKAKESSIREDKPFGLLFIAALPIPIGLIVCSIEASGIERDPV